MIQCRQLPGAPGKAAASPPAGRALLTFGPQDNGGTEFPVQPGSQLGSLIVSYLVGSSQLATGKALVTKELQGDKPLEICKEAAGAMAWPLTGRSGDRVPGSGSLGKIPEHLRLHCFPWKIWTMDKMISAFSFCVGKTDPKAIFPNKSMLWIATLMCLIPVLQWDSSPG